MRDLSIAKKYIITLKQKQKVLSEMLVLYCMLFFYFALLLMSRARFINQITWDCRTLIQNLTGKIVRLKLAFSFKGGKI